MFSVPQIHDVVVATPFGSLTQASSAVVQLPTMVLSETGPRVFYTLQPMNREPFDTPA